MKAYKAPWHKQYEQAKVDADGYSFDSQLELALYGHLKILQAAGELWQIHVKPNVHLTDARILMIPDFKAIDRKLGEEVYFEAKGFETDVWRIKRKLWGHYGPGRLHVYKGTAKRLVLAETIVPKTAQLT